MVKSTRVTAIGRVLFMLPSKSLLLKFKSSCLSSSVLMTSQFHVTVESLSPINVRRYLSKMLQVCLLKLRVSGSGGIARLSSNPDFLYRTRLPLPLSLDICSFVMKRFLFSHL